jgi:hypothetical protein
MNIPLYNKLYEYNLHANMKDHGFDYGSKWKFIWIGKVR